MTHFEKLLEDAEQNDVTVIEKFDLSNTRLKGLYCDGAVALSDEIETDIERACVLAEEIGHHETSFGNILDQSVTINRKQELRARVIAYNKLVGLRGIVDAYNHHCQSLYDTAEYLEVTEEFLNDTLVYYKDKYGVFTTIDNYAIIFEPAIAVFELI